MHSNFIGVHGWLDFKVESNGNFDLGGNGGFGDVEVEGGEDFLEKLSEARVRFRAY